MVQEERNRLERVEIYHQGLISGDSMIIGYRTLFLTFEAILLTLGVGLMAIEKEKFTLIPIIIGIIFCLASVPVFAWGRRRVDYWRDRIFEEIKGTDLEKIFEIYQPVYIWRVPSPTSPRFWFDLISPIIIGIAWLVILFIGYL